LYTQTGRLDAGAVAVLTQKTVNGIAYYDDPISQELPVGLSGVFDFYFTLMDAQGNEGDFSPVVTITVDTTIPPTLGQPVQLG
jgi:hypothetical protein